MGRRDPEEGAPISRLARATRAPVWGLLVAASFSCGGDSPAKPPAGRVSTVLPTVPEPSPTIERYTDLLRLGEHGQIVLAGSAARPQVWDHAKHYRPVLAQADGRVRLGPIPGGEECRAVFGVAMQGDLGQGSVRVRMAVEPEGAGAAQTVFEAEFTQAEGDWIDRREPLPGAGRGPFAIVLEVENLSGARASAGWAAPHVVCSVVRPKLPPLAQPHVILISLDTLRADHLGIYGYARNTSPTIDAFATEAWVFDQAYSPVTWTLPSHASLFTAVAPPVHRGGHASPFDPLPADGPRTLAESLRDAGYWTIGFTAGGLMSQRNGLHRGFQWWTERTRANLGATLPGVFDAIGTAPTRPLFLMLHTYDIHGPYAYLPDADSIELGPRTGRTHGVAGSRCGAPECGDAAAEWNRIREIPYHRYQRFERFDGLDEVVDAYDRGIRFVDAQLRVLFDRLRDVGIYEDAMIVITSDHGESLYERGLYVGHSYTLHDEEIRIPLLVRLPGGHRGRSDAMVQLMDVAPWILDVAGVPRPASFEGISPIARQRGEAPPREMAEGEATHTGQRYARSHGWKAIAAATQPMKTLLPSELASRFRSRGQIYDMVSDPDERSPLSPEAALPAEAGPVASAAAASPQPGLANAASEPQLDPTQEQQLRELGYLR